MKMSIDNLTELGAKSETPQNPDDARLECIRRLDDTRDFLVRFSIPEFTSLCPMTGQPDFAHLVIDYVPNKLLIESKALKLLMLSYRNHGAFHEACTLDIAERLCGAMEPVWFRISAFWYPRGGIPIDVFWQTGLPPLSVHVPPIEIPVYRAR